MPIALLFVAILVIVTGIKGNYAEVGNQFSTDVMGSGGFLQFLVGIFGIAIFFRMIGMPNAGRAFISLVIVVFLLQNSSVLTALENVVGGSGTTAATSSTSAALTAAASIPTTAVTGSSSASSSTSAALTAAASIPTTAVTGR